jgi:release factor glutamine methyltransferase
MAVNLRTIKDIRNYLARELTQIYHEQEISSFTKIIIYSVLEVNKVNLLSGNEYPVTRQDAEKVIHICNELKTGKPLQYVIGETVFYDCIIKVNSSTLIPRPETEELVDLIIRENTGFIGKIIDIGTGSGCIAIALAVNFPDSEITGIDISEKALKTASENAKLNNVEITLLKADIFNHELYKMHDVDLIVSNPPYVRISEKQHMSINVLDFEPHTALFVPDNDPLVFYQAILDLAGYILNPGGKLYFEINEAMGNPLHQLLELSGYKGIKIVHDINGKERMIKARKDV